jgi:tetratricopeptide (TPR) repeat protein
MSEPQRPERVRAAGEVPERDRDGRVEELLLTGLDHYFAGRYDLAINVWTRVLFLDRGHARARAYIERARGAIAERQREGDELVHSGAAAFDRGDVTEARQLLSAALERGAASEEALALLNRLQRLDAVSVPAEPAANPRISALLGARLPRGARPAAGRSPMLWVAAGVAAGLLVAVVAGVVLWIRGDAWLAWTPPPVAGPSTLAIEPVPVPAASDVWMARGRDFYAKGRLHEALVALETIRPGDPLRGQADACRAAIQRQLLAAARGADAALPADALRVACGVPGR